MRAPVAWPDWPHPSAAEPLEPIMHDPMDDQFWLVWLMVGDVLFAIAFYLVVATPLDHTSCRLPF